MPEHNAEVKHPLTSTRTSNHPEEDDIAEIQSTEAAEAAENNWTTVDEQLVHVDIHGLYRDDVLKSFPAPKIFRQTATSASHAIQKQVNLRKMHLTYCLLVAKKNTNVDKVIRTTIYIEDIKLTQHLDHP